MNKDFLNAITYKQTRTIGSYGDPRVLYKTDIDLQEIIKLNAATDAPGVLDSLHTFFIKIFDYCENNPRCIITDFKMGRFGANVPVRWKGADVRRGYIDIDTLNRKTFRDLLQMRSIIKIDFILRDSADRLQEVSKNFYIIYSNANTTPAEMLYENMRVSLLRDYQKYKANGDTYKAYKRLYAYYKHGNDTQGIQRTLQYINNPRYALPYLKKYREDLVAQYIDAAKLSVAEARRVFLANCPTD